MVMSRKTMSRMLRGALVIGGVLCGLFVFAFLPFYVKEQIRCEMAEAGCFWPCVSFGVILSLPVFAALVPCWEFFGTLREQGGAFTKRNALLFAQISRLALADTILFPVGVIVLAAMGYGFAALTVVGIPLGIFCGGTVSLVCHVLSRMVGEAAALREENDMTI